MDRFWHRTVITRQWSVFLLSALAACSGGDQGGGCGPPAAIDGAWQGGVVNAAEVNRMARFSGKSAIGALEQGHLEALARQIGWTGSREAQRLERGLNFLATTGSAAPFIGLFGTVIGIINAFQSIGRTGSASLAVVAPGIAEALIATAVGLFAAIPATIFYNIFVGQLRSLMALIDLFGVEYEGDLHRMASAKHDASPSTQR